MNFFLSDKFLKSDKGPETKGTKKEEEEIK